MDTTNIINSFLESSGMSQAELARRSGVPETTVSQVRRSGTCTLSTWGKIAAVIGSSANIRFVQEEDANGPPHAA